MDSDKACCQGDQIGRIFAFRVSVFFGLLFENYRSSLKFGHFSYNGERCGLILTKIGWATFWAIFSQTRPVTLFISAGKQKTET
jgi:hypothetical protein